MQNRNFTRSALIVCIALFLFSCNLEDQVVNTQPDRGQTIGDDANSPPTPNINPPDTHSSDTAGDTDVSGPDTDSPDTPGDTDVSGPDTDCVPGTCTSLGAQCGVVDDGCVGILECGTCESGTCDQDNQCTCSPETNDAFCDRLGAECGEFTAPDNCGTERTAFCDCADCTNCASRDGWYPVGSPDPCCRFDVNGAGSCQCQNEELRSYTCDGTRCTYTVTSERIQQSDPCQLCNNGCNFETGACCLEVEICLL